MEVSNLTSFGVMQTMKWQLGNKHGGGASYRIACDCHDPDHDAVIMFDLEDGIFEIHFYKKLSWSTWWRSEHWYQRAWLRIKAATKILFTGWIELEDELVVGVDSIPDIIKVFEEAKMKIEEYELSWKKEHVTKNGTTDNQEHTGQ